MLAYHGDKSIKTKYLQRVKLHAAADELIKGKGWENGKGCAIGCTLEAYDHSRYPIELGIPEALARLEDVIFEGLPNGKAKAWPAAFLAAIRPGADLSLVQWKFLHWLQIENHKFAIKRKFPAEVVNTIKQCANTLIPFTKGEKFNKSAARSVARSAAQSAESAAWSAESAAYVKMSHKLLKLLKAAK